MGLFVKPINSTTLPENTQEIARAIYDLLIAGKDITTIFVEDGYKMEYCKWVRNKALKLETDSIASIQANPSQTDVQWAQSVSVPLLSKVQVLTDIIHYNPTFDETRTFEQFVTQMTGV